MQYHNANFDLAEIIVPLCYSPWTNLDISPTGDIAPCCKFVTNHYAVKHNIKHHTIQEYHDGNLLKEVKQHMLDGVWPRGCERCHIEEQHNVKSKRQLDHDRWHQHYDQYDIDSGTAITASIAFGNTCNLKCITCGPQSSSRWQKEYFDIHKINIESLDFYQRDFVETFVDTNANIIHIDIPGGEPFLSGVAQQQQMLSKYVQNGRSKYISLHYTTNATIYPNDSWWLLWQNFREIDIQISVDAVDERFEYIRFPADWKQFVGNVYRYIQATKSTSNLRMSVSHTVSAYNIFYLDEFFDWCNNAGLPTPWLGRVHRPEHMRPTVWPDLVRTTIAEKLHRSRYDESKKWANLMTLENDSVYFKQFQQMLEKHDAYRALDFKKTFPEMAKFI